MKLKWWLKRRQGRCWISIVRSGCRKLDTSVSLRLPFAFSLLPFADFFLLFHSILLHKLNCTGTRVNNCGHDTFWFILLHEIQPPLQLIIIPVLAICVLAFRSLRELKEKQVLQQIMFYITNTCSVADQDGKET